MILDYVPTLITIGSFVLTAAGMLVTVTWRISQVAADLRKAIVESRNEVEAKRETMERDIGESILAMRTKVHEVETWARDTFVRKDSFEGGFTRLEKVISDRFSSVDARMERMEGKIDARR